MKSYIKYLSLSFCLMLTFAAKAQDVKILASIDSTQLAIGQQTLIHYEVTQDLSQNVSFPIFKDTLIRGIEILKVFPQDTTVLSETRIAVKQDILVTSFDSALYFIPGAEFISENNVYKSNPLALKVLTYEIDPESTDVFDIKNIRKPDFVLSDYYWIIICIVLIILAALGVWFAYKRWKNRVGNAEMLDNTPKIPPYDQAILSLDELKEKKLWQQGFNKEYYTSLTDILRKYLNDEYGINAMEMTTSEILQAIKNNENVKPALNNLKQILELSDFVKFAKMTPLKDDNEMSMANALIFVNETKPKPVEVEDEDSEDEEKA